MRGEGSPAARGKSIFMRSLPAAVVHGSRDFYFSGEGGRGFTTEITEFAEEAIGKKRTGGLILPR
jgi:hypothetical protein